MVYQIVPFALQKKECKMFLNTLKSIKTPTGFGATLHNSFNKEDYFSGLKSHDFYNILHYHLPLSI
jgi:hypothetical protein